MTIDPVEERQIRRQTTPAQRFALEMQNFASASLRISAMAAVLTFGLILSLLTVDIPARIFDRAFSIIPGIKPSLWLSWGSMFMALIPLMAILFARRRGGDEASRAIIFGWMLLALFILFELSVLAPIIEAGDFPGTRYIVALVASTMTGQLVAVSLYDVARGGGHWWRAPLYASLIGFIVTGLIYFPVAYWQSGIPWMQWAVADFMVKAIIALCFLPVYGMVRRAMRPLGGYGG